MGRLLAAGCGWDSRSVVRDCRVRPPEVRWYHKLDVVYLLQDSLVLALWWVCGHPTEDHHDSAIFLREVIIVAVLGR
jgi:hypothetical protein